MKLSWAANLVLKWVCPVLSFPERFQPITAAAMCTVALKVLEPGTFNAESQYFIPLFNRISWLCRQHLRGYETSNGGATQVQQVMTFQITLILTFYCLPWERDPSENVRTDPILRLMPSENLAGSHLDFSLKTGADFQPVGENGPTLVKSLEATLLYNDSQHNIPALERLQLCSGCHSIQ